MQRLLFIGGLALLVLAVAVVLGGIVAGLNGDFVATESRTAMGDEVTDADREQIQSLAGIDLPDEAVVHAIQFESALDQSLRAVVALAAPDAVALMARPPLADAAWVSTDAVPTLAAALDAWPTYPTTGATTRGLRASLDLAPGRVLSMEIDTVSTPRVLHLTWQTF